MEVISSINAFKPYPEHRKRWHKKTTSGCIPCRKRRVKCDEQKPRCKGCTRNKIECHGEDYGIPQLDGSNAVVVQQINGHDWTPLGSAVKGTSEPHALLTALAGRTPDGLSSETFLEQTTAETLPGTPSPFFWKGSSDPFGASSIELTPSTNRMLTCYLNAFLPSIWVPTWLRESPDVNFPSEALVKSKNLAGSRSMARSVDFTFRHPQSLPSWFFVALTCMRDVFEPLDPEGFWTLLLQYRTHSLRILRESISNIQIGSPPPVTVILQILRIFGAECMINEYLAAKAHAVVIPWIEKVQLEPRVFSGLMGALMFNDTDVACKLFRKTALDYETWFPSKLNSFWTHGESFLPSLPHEIENHLHADLARLEGDNIKRALRRLRLSLYLRDTLGPLGLSLTENSDTMCAYIQSRAVHDIGLLINQAVDIISGARLPTKQGVPVDSEILCDANFYAALTLTTLYNIRKYLHDCSFNGHDLREAPLIIPKLKRCLIQFLLERVVTMRGQEHSGIDEILFWIYFTGAWHGQKQSCYSRSARCNHNNRTTTDQSLWKPDEKCPRHNSTTIWFSSQLAEQARLLKVPRWPEARRLLTRFAFSDIMRPHPSTWYEEIVEMQELVDSPIATTVDML